MSSLGRSLVTTATEGKQASSPLTFLARTVQVHNLTASWLYVPDAGQPVPPFTYGATLPLQGTSQARISWSTPAGITPATVGTGTATFLWLEDALPPSNGQQVVVPSQQVTCALSNIITTSGATGTITSNILSFTLPVNAGSPSISVDATLPAGTNSLIFAGDLDEISGLDQVTLTVIGNQSKTVWLSAVSVLPDFPLSCIVSPSQDSTVRVTMTDGTNSKITGTLAVVASFGTQAVSVINSGGVPIDINIQKVNGSNVLYPLNVDLTTVNGVTAKTTTDGSLIVAENGGTGSTAAGNNAAATITLTGVVNNAWRILSLTAGFNGAAAAGGPALTVKDGASTVWATNIGSPAAGSTYHYSFPSGGLLITTGATATISLAASGAGGVFGTVNCTAINL